MSSLGVPDNVRRQVGTEIVLRGCGLAAEDTVTPWAPVSRTSKIGITLFSALVVTANLCTSLTRWSFILTKSS
jgi:hypothetical protein